MKSIDGDFVKCIVDVVRNCQSCSKWKQHFCVSPAKNENCKPMLVLAGPFNFSKFGLDVLHYFAVILIYTSLGNNVGCPFMTS